MCLSRGPLNWEIKPRNFAESLHCLSAAARLTTLSLGDGGLETASEVGSSAPGDLETWTNVDCDVGGKEIPQSCFRGKRLTNFNFFFLYFFLLLGAFAKLMAEREWRPDEDSLWLPAPDWVSERRKIAI